MGTGVKMRAEESSADALAAARLLAELGERAQQELIGREFGCVV